MKSTVTNAIRFLQDQYTQMNWQYHDLPDARENEKIYYWPGSADEDILLCVHKSSNEQELFHRHDYFYFNYTYKGCYDSISFKYDNKITIEEGELYAGQPFAGHALCAHNNQETIIIGLLIRKELFFRSFLPLLSANSNLFHFLLNPATNKFSDEYIHLRISDGGIIRSLLEMMLIEYAFCRPDTQDILRPLALSFILYVARQYIAKQPKAASQSLLEQISGYISEHFETVTLGEIARNFSYHPNYISTILRRDLGKSFSELLLEQRMERAAVLLSGTNLTTSEIATMLGYGNTSNFYKAFRSYFHMTPREYTSARAQ